MADDNIRQTAKVIRFPAGGRSGLSGPNKVPPPALHIAVDGWYHQEAIYEKKLGQPMGKDG